MANGSIKWVYGGKQLRIKAKNGVHTDTVL